LQYACDVSVENLGLANAAVLATNLLTRLLCLPLFNWLVRRFCPARLVSVSMIIAAITAAPVALATYLTKQWPLMIIAAFILAINGGIADICLRVLLGFVTDEDQVVRTMEGRDSSDDPCFIAPRRDGLFWSVWTLAEALAGLYIGVGTAVFGMAGLDGKLDDEGKSQPAAAVLAITIFFLGAVVLNYALAAFAMNGFPLRGERLAELQGRYEQLFRDVEKKTSFRRSSLKMADSEMAMGSGSISS
jgi:Na+/melibiose symporter-like transporter